ncbi:MAG: hypothetical protein ABI425_04490 [Patescibacteria group bacterium]
MSILDDSLYQLQMNAGDQPVSKKRRSSNGKKPFVLGALVLVVVMGIFISVKLAQKGQDVRNQASVDNGQVLITSTATGSLAVGQPASVTLKANTQGVNVNGIALTFTINTSQSQPLTVAPTVQTVSSSGLDFLVPPMITQNSNGMYQVALNLAKPVVTEVFSSSTPQDIVTVNFSPTAAGIISFQFDNVSSKAPVANSVNGDDTLKTIQPMDFNVVSPTTVSTITLTPTLTATQTLTLSPTLTPVVTLAPSSTAVPSNTPATTVPVGATCNSIQILNASTGLPNTAPHRGDTVQFECGAINGAVRYEFQMIVPGQTTYSPLLAVSNGARVSQSYTISSTGDFIAQCRMCTGAAASTCQAWE